MRRVIKFSATWCHPCKILSENLEKIQTDIPIEAFDIDDKFEVAQEFGIRGVPTMVMLENGAEIKRVSGALPVAKVKEFLNG